MCRSAYVDDVECTNHRELKAALKLDKLPIAGEYKCDFENGRDYCLCSVDIPEAARLAGYVATDIEVRDGEEYHGMDWTLTRLEKSQ
jgi:hypothetical protein